MSWKETYAKKDGFEFPIISIMKCDYCGAEIEWYNVHQDMKSQEAINTAWELDGWVSIGLYQYNGDEEIPSAVEIEQCTYHACPECRKKILKLEYDGTPYPKQKVRKSKEDE